MKQLPADPRFEQWRAQARAFLVRRVPPDCAHFAALGGSQTTMFAAQGTADAKPSGRLTVPKYFATTAPYVAAHAAADRWDLMYRMVWRLTHGEPHLFELASDSDVLRFHRYLHAVQRDIHKCHAFVRFVRQPNDAYISWYRPDHAILRLAAPHFVRRYPNMKFAIFTEQESVHWDTQQLSVGPGAARSSFAAALSQDPDARNLWDTYYASIFNPARLKLKAMRQEMPARYWSVMPETRQIDALVHQASSRLQSFSASTQASTLEHVPNNPNSLAQLRTAAQACAACEFAQRATQTVFGAGSVDARVVFVGEQPGDEEDVQGSPFVGPAGRLFDQALQEAGIVREDVYVTNAVKHFKWQPRGKKRLHQRPLARDVAACKPWLAAEMALLKPQILVCLGATAAQAVFGKVVRVGDVSGHWHATAFCQNTWVTAHPSSVLRQPDDVARREAYGKLVEDLKRVRQRAATWSRLTDPPTAPPAHRR